MWESHVAQLPYIPRRSWPGRLNKSKVALCWLRVAQRGALGATWTLISGIYSSLMVVGLSLLLCLPVSRSSQPAGRECGMYQTAVRKGYKPLCFSAASVLRRGRPQELQLSLVVIWDVGKWQYWSCRANSHHRQIEILSVTGEILVITLLSGIFLTFSKRRRHNYRATVSVLLRQRAHRLTRRTASTKEEPRRHPTALTSQQQERALSQCSVLHGMDNTLNILVNQPNQK